LHPPGAIYTSAGTASLAVGTHRLRLTVTGAGTFVTPLLRVKIGTSVGGSQDYNNVHALQYATQELEVDFTVTTAGARYVTLQNAAEDETGANGLDGSVEVLTDSGATYGPYLMATIFSTDEWRVATNGSIFLALLTGTSRNLYRSSDGTSYARVGSPPAGTWNALAYDPVHEVFLALGESVMATSDDGGDTWDPVVSPPAGSWRAASILGSVMVAVGTNVAATSADLATWTPRTIDAGAWRAVATNAGSSIPSGLYTVTSPSVGTLDTATFTFTSGSGAIGTTGAPQAIRLVSVGIVDEVPEAQLGASLYTNASQGGALEQNGEPPDCLDMAVYQGHTFYVRRLPRIHADEGGSA
jgi:hypothetical protein